MARKPSAKAAIAAERAALHARLAELDALEKQAKVSARAAKSSGKAASKAGKAEIREGKSLADEGKALIRAAQQGLFKRLSGPAKRYAPIEGYAPLGVTLDPRDGAISTRQYNKLAAEIRGYEKRAQPKKLRNKVNHKRNIILSRKRDFQAQQRNKGIKIAIKDVGRDADYQKIAALLDAKTKPSRKYPKGRANETSVKRALILLGRREGLPNSVKVGDSPKEHIRDQVTGIWHKKV